MNFPPGTPFFLENASRQLFAIRFDVNPDKTSRGVVLHLPAFGEEMNKSRAMVASQAREMAELGYKVLVVDYFGTGDSGGEFVESDWHGWLEDVRYCLRYLHSEVSGPVTLWGLRLGALMAIELAQEPDLNISQLLLWNPVLQGEQHMAQFLRLRLANSMMQGETKEKLSDLKVRLEEEGLLEVAGYELSYALFDQVCKSKAKEMVLPSDLKVYWADVAATIKALPVPAQNLIDQWKEQGLQVDTNQIEASQFWATQEISRADELIEKTAAWLSGVPTNA